MSDNPKRFEVTAFNLLTEQRITLGWTDTYADAKEIVLVSYYHPSQCFPRIEDHRPVIDHSDAQLRTEAPLP